MGKINPLIDIIIILCTAEEKCGVGSMWAAHCSHREVPRLRGGPLKRGLLGASLCSSFLSTGSC